MGKYPNQYYENACDLPLRLVNENARSLTEEDNPLSVLKEFRGKRSSSMCVINEVEDETDHRSGSSPVERTVEVSQRRTFSSDDLRRLRHTRSYIPREIHQILPCCRRCGLRLMGANDRANRYDGQSRFHS